MLSDAYQNDSQPKSGEEYMTRLSGSFTSLHSPIAGLLVLGLSLSLSSCLLSPARLPALPDFKARASALVRGSASGSASGSAAGSASGSAAGVSGSVTGGASGGAQVGSPTGAQAGSASGGAPGGPAAAPANGAKATVADLAAPPTPRAAEDRAYELFMRDLPGYLSRLTFMVYYNPESGLDPRIAKVAVSQAARYLKERNETDGSSITIIDFDQVEKNRGDERLAYQAGTGQAEDLIQHLAGKFNANIYIEIDCSVTTEAREGRFYATGQGALKMIDVSTATLLGSIPFQNTSFNPYSELDAATNLVASSVWLAMPRLYEQVRSLAAASIQRGLRYEILVQNSQDSRKMLAFEDYLADRVRDTQELSYSPSETKLYVYSFQTNVAIRQLILEAAAKAGMPDFNLVMTRDKSFTFNTGL
jgi:hypothetical protein